MSLFSSVSKTTEPVFRFVENNGWKLMGAQVRPKDTRTSEQIAATIEYFIKRNPEMEEFRQAVKEMKPEHKNLVADTLELASKNEMTMTPVDLNKINPKTGKSTLKYIMEGLTKASKDNPDAIEFAQEIINHTDTTTSKYALASLVEAFKIPETAPLFKETKNLVGDFAKQALDGGYLGDYSKQKNFMELIFSFVNPNTTPDRIGVVKKLVKFADTLKNDFEIELGQILYGPAGAKQMENNFNSLETVAKLADSQGKVFDLSAFLTKNVDLK